VNAWIPCLLLIATGLLPASPAFAGDACVAEGYEPGSTGYQMCVSRRGAKSYGGGDPCVAEGYDRGSTGYEMCLSRRGNNPPRLGEADSLEGKLTTRYGERCKLAGYAPGTGVFGQCLLAYDERAQAADAQIDSERRAALLQLYMYQQGQFAQQQAQRDAQMQRMQQQLLNSNRPGAICTSVFGNQLVSRPCY
jgi:hypothetical protein